MCIVIEKKPRVCAYGYANCQTLDNSSNNGFTCHNKHLNKRFKIFDGWFIPWNYLRLLLPDFCMCIFFLKDCVLNDTSRLSFYLHLTDVVWYLPSKNSLQSACEISDFCRLAGKQLPVSYQDYNPLQVPLLLVNFICLVYFPI